MTSSKPSKAAKPPTRAKRSTTLWTIPKPGDVLNYAYLWEYQAAQGLEEGLKDRPCVIVLIINNDTEHPVLSVCAVTSQRPDTETGFVEMPPRIKKHLGLTDRDKSYIVTTEINRFTWPGPEIRPFEHKGQTTVSYGQIPEKLLIEIKGSLIKNIRLHKLKTTSRD